MAKTNELKLNNFIDMEDISFSLTDIRSAIPKVNFRKIKLSRTNDINNSLKTKNITRIYLDDSLLKLDLPIKRVTEQESYDDHGREIKNPLRKKIELEETVPQITNEFLEQEEGIVEKIDKKEENIDVKEDITFNMEAQVAHEEENIILSPSVVSLPPFKKDVLSASGEQGNLVWPPKKQKEKKKFSKKRYKQKPYYLQEEKKPEEKKVEAKPTVFPWASANQEYEFLENIVQGGLESELLDLSYEKPSYEPKKINAEKITNLNQLVLKALVPEVQGDLYVGKFIFNKDSKENKVDVPLFKNVRIDYGIKLLGKGVKMFDKFSNLGGKVSPVRVVILSSLTITLGYLVWSYYFPNLQFIPQFEKKKEKVIVRDLFKEEHSYKKSLNVPKEKPPAQTKIEKGVQQEEFFKPISEQERISLIQKARESVESRLDPFGQEGVLPRSVIEQKIKEKEEEQKAPPDIALERKQVELVGVISANNKDLALVNLYTADYSVGPEDDIITKETKLKTALSMSVPNRIEVSLLDPVDEWYVKKITKAKGRNEDPSIELVKGDKKFKLRVGQKVLLPEEKPLDDSEEQSDTRNDIKEIEKVKS